MLTSLRSRVTPKATTENNVIEMQNEFADFLYSQHINPFQSRNIHVFHINDQTSQPALQLHSEHELSKNFMTDFSDRLNQQWSHFCKLNTADTQDNTQLTQQIIHLTQNRLDLFMLALQMQQNVQQNIQPLIDIVDYIPGQFTAFYFKQLVDLANANIKLETFLHVLKLHSLNLQEFSNLAYILQNLNPDLLDYIGHNKNIFSLDYNKVVHFVRFLNQDLFVAQHSLKFADSFIDCFDTFNAYVRLVTNPHHHNPRVFKFIHQLFTNIQKPFTNAHWVSDIISQQQHLDLGYYLGFFNTYSESQVRSFVSYLSLL